MKRFIVGFIPLSFMVGLPAIAGRMACVLAAVLLACASSAHAQVIEEGGFPVKGGDNSGEPFSLSCPPRLYVEEGESVSLSCSATAVPEEGVRYGWESLSGDGLHLLSDAQALTPLFTAPLSGESAEYAYRLTAMSVGVYETATVTVSVEGVPEETVGAPVVQEECDSLVDFEGGREGCVPWDKAPSQDPFGGIPEDEGIVPWPSFPEGPGAEEKEFPGSSGAGSFPQAPPRLECPVAVFLEELETGLIECHSWDASGEEYLGYSWEPVGSTTRDYLDNPRLIPEDSPTPSVVAPETPVYETLESFHSGETTSLYRYRLTATSRATGLSSSSEVEVYVSSSRPSVYCPLEIVVEEGETVQLDCEGADPLSARMDYDEEGASLLWEWEGLWATSTAPLDATDRSSPLFTAPVGSAGEEYHYIASMTSQASGALRMARRKVTVRVVAGNADLNKVEGSNKAEVTSRGGPLADLEVTCSNSIWFNPPIPELLSGYYYYSRRAGSADQPLNCSASGGPAGATLTYAWAATLDTQDTRQLTSTTNPNTTFTTPFLVVVPVSPIVQGAQVFSYSLTVTASVAGQNPVTKRIDVLITVVPGNRNLYHFIESYEVDEGWPDFPFMLHVLGGNPSTSFEYFWSGTDVANRLIDNEVRQPTFMVPALGEIDNDTNYEYQFTITRSGGGSGTGTVMVKVFNVSFTDITCNDANVLEGAADFRLDCSATDEPPGATYAWEARSGTTIAELIAGRDGPTPTFSPPDGIQASSPSPQDNGETYEYTVTMSADGSVVATADVTITVRDKDIICWVSSTMALDPRVTEKSVDEGDANVELTTCEGGISGPGGPYDYSWIAGGQIAGMEAQFLTATDRDDTFFIVPDDVPRDTDYTFDFKVSRRSEPNNFYGTLFRITVENLDPVGCHDPPGFVYDTVPPFALDCTDTGALSGVTWEWGPLNLLTHLTNTSSVSPTFTPPTLFLEEAKEFPYAVRAKVGGVDMGGSEVTIRVRRTPHTSMVCNGERFGSVEYTPFEGDEDIVLDCTASGGFGVGPYAYEWTGRNGAVVPGKLSSATIRNPTFDVPEEVDANETYEYTLTASAENARDGEFDVTVTVLNKPDIVIDCPGDPYSEYEGEDDIVLDCSASGAPEGSTYDYVWTPRGSTPNTDKLIAGTDGPTPTFDVPDEVDAAGETYEYTLTASAENAEDASAPVTVKVLNKPEIMVTCTTPLPVYEGAAEFDLDCSASGAPQGSAYNYVWTGRGSTVVPGQLRGTDGPTPTFDVPPNVDADTDYEYTLTVSVDNAEDASADVTVRVLNKPEIMVTCTGNPYEKYEGEEDFALDCTATGGPSGSTYAYEWTGRNGTVVPGKLSDATIRNPTFDVPGEVDADGETYEYTLTASAANAEDGVVDVTVTVQNKPPLALVCTPVAPVYEGAAEFDLDCSASGAPQGSAYNYVWTGRGSTVVPGQLRGTDGPTPTFDVPPNVDADTDYEYTLTASAENAESATADVTVRVLNKPPLALVCTPPAPVYEGAAEFDLDCSASGAPQGSAYNYVWTGRGSTVVPGQLRGTDGPTPTFDVPPNVDADTDYEYTLTVSADNAEDASADVTVRVLNKPPLALVCTPPAPVYEGAAEFDLDCSASGAPQGSAYNYVWTGRGSTVVPGQLRGTDGPTPTFDVPPNVDADTDYEYTLTVSAEGAEDGVARVTVTVKNKPEIMVTCTGNPYEKYEGSEDFALDCTATGGPSGSTYAYEWTGRNGTVVPGKLSDATIRNPTFDVPGEVDADGETYEYTLTASAANAEDGVVDVTVTVLNKPPLALVCTPVAPVYEGAADFDLDCSASGAPQGSAYNYVWTGRGSTVVPGQLRGTDGPTPTFDVPPNVDADTDYEYTLTVSADNAEDASADVTVRVLNKPPLALVCTPPAPVYEGAAEFDLDCSASGAPQGSAYNYVWTGRGSTVVPGQLRGTDGPTPTFDVPPNVDADTDYEYTLTVSADNAEDASADVTVRVLNKPPLALVCTPPAPVYEGAAEFDLDCSASGAPQGSAYNYVWTGRGSTVVPGQLRGTDGPTPTFDVPPNVDADTDYEYTLTVSVDNAEDASADVTVRVLNKPPLVLVCTPPAPVYEGAADFDLDCSASGAPQGSAYNYVWTGRGSTVVPGQLRGTDGPTPTFDVPPNVDADTDYEYTLTVLAENAEDAAANVTVRVLDKKPLSVVCATPSPVYEGSEDFALDCVATGAPAGSVPMYVWTGRGSTPNTELLVSGTDGPAPTFAVPETVEADETHEYLLTASAENAIDATAGVTVTVLKLGSIALICSSSPLVYEGSADFVLDCSISGDTGDTDYTYVWTARGATANTAQLSAADIPSPTFYVPDALNETTTYEYLLTVSAENTIDAAAEVTVTVLNRGTLAVACAPPPLVYEGAADFDLDCTASEAPVGSVPMYVWTARGSTANTALLVSGTDGPTPTFAVPEDLNATTTYEYLLTVSAENAESGSAAVTVTVLNHGALSVVCVDPPSVYEGSEDIMLDCSASGAPVGSEYAYAWTARGSTANTALLIAGTDGPTPTFAVPDALDETTTYEYLLTVSAENAEDGSAEVTVTVLNVGTLRVVCALPASVYEGSADFALDCSASGAPAGSVYAYAWTARGDTPDTALLIAGTDGPTPTFSVPDDLPATTTYEYLLAVSAANAEDATAEVTVTVLNREMLTITCPVPRSVYEGSEDFELDCSASGASDYTYAWTARGSTANTDQLSAADIVSPTFYVPDELDATTTYEYLLTASAENTISGTAEVSVTVLNRPPLSVVCTDPGSIYEGSADFELNCSASGAPSGSVYEYAWTARGSTANTDQLSAIDISSPTFYVPEELDATATYEYLLTASAENAESGMAEVTVTVLNRRPLSVTCDDTEVYEGEGDITLDCSASGAPSGSDYTYVWTARGGTANTDLLIAGTDGPTPTFSVPDEVDENGETYEYLLTVSADNAEDASAEVTVNVLDGLPLAFVDDSIAGRVYVFTVGETITDILLPEATGGLFPYTHILTPLLPRGLSLKVDGDPTRTISGTPLEVSPGTEYTWQIVDANSESVSLAFFIEVAPAAEPSRPVAEPSEALSLGVTVSTSSLRFGVQSADTQVSLDPMTDQLSTYISGPYHGGRMTLSQGGSEALDENGEMDLSIELASPVTLQRKGGVEAFSIILSPSWSLAESCEQLSSQTIGSLYTEVTLSDGDCRLLRFGGELDLTGVPSGHYAGSMDIILRSGESEETHTVEVDVTVVPAQQVITIGPRGVRFSTSREVPAGLTEEQNLSIYPHVAFLTEGKPHGTFELSNPSLIPLEISVSARFGYTEATENGREVVVEDASGSHLGDLSEVVDIHPGVLVLMPGEKGLVRYGMQEGVLAAMADKGYAAFFDVVSSPRQYVRTDQMPEEVAGDRTARVTMRVPGVYVPGEGASQLRAVLLSISYVGSLSATFLLETQDHPFVGEVLAYDGEGRELGRRETLVYTRSRVRIPLNRVPEGGAVFLRFAPRGSDRVPLPASVEWDAPRRDIGAADKDRTRTPETLVQRP